MERFDILPLVRTTGGRFAFGKALLAGLSLAGAWISLEVLNAGSFSSFHARAQNPPATSSTAASPAAAQTRMLNTVVLDPAHGGTDPGARGAQGIRESDLVLDLTFQVRRALEAQGYQVLQTRSGNEDPSFDDRSAMVNAQRSAVFVSLHVSSMGLPGTARVYAMSDLPSRAGAGLPSWDYAQAPYLSLSRKFGDAVQGQLAQRFKGSPGAVLTASVRQLRTIAAPAIAIEIASVSVQDRGDLDRMMPGVADAVARGVAAFRPSYVLAGEAGGQP